MSDLPSASTRIDDTAGPAAAGIDLCAVIACVATKDDAKPRLYSNAASIYANHGYAEGVDYAAIHMAKTGLPVLFVPIPIATPGVVGRIDQSGNTNSSAVSCTVGGSGALDECDVVVKVNKGGVVGTDQISIDLSLDGGRSFKKGIKIGTAVTYTIPYVGLVLTFGAGSLTAGETVLKCHSTAPMWDQTGIDAAETGLANQFKQVRSWQVIGDVFTDDDVGIVSDAVDAYEETVERYVQAKLALRDRAPQAFMSQTRVNMTGAPSITFTNSGSADTITRSAGSFIDDGFTVGDTVRVTGAVASAGANNVTGVIASLSDTVITFGASPALTTEGPIGGVSITAEPTLTFAAVGATGDTITRNRGSWLADGFHEGDLVTIDGTTSNDQTATVGIDTVSATVITFDTTPLVNEVIGSFGVSISTGETKADHVAALDAEMEDVTNRRIELGFGRKRVKSPFLDGLMRRSSSWHENWRAYQHDVHVASFKVSLGALDDIGLDDADGNLEEFDERVDGGALAAGFTCLRTWSDRGGAYVAKAVTRAGSASKLSRSQNMAVANLAQSVCQTEATNAIGEDLVLNDDGTATQESLATIAQRVNSGLKRNLLADKRGEGKRCSNVSWTPNSGDDLSQPDATLTATLALNFKGTIEHIITKIKVNAGA